MNILAICFAVVFASIFSLGVYANCTTPYLSREAATAFITSLLFVYYALIGLGKFVLFVLALLRKHEMIKPAGMAVLILTGVGLVGYGVNEYLSSRPIKAEVAQDSIQWKSPEPEKVKLSEVTRAVEAVPDPEVVHAKSPDEVTEQPRNAGLEALMKAKK